MSYTSKQKSKLIQPAYIPKILISNFKDVYIPLGFSIKNIGKDLYKVKLPHSWELGNHTDLYIEIIDENGHIRGHYYYKSSSGCITLTSKYYVNYISASKETLQAPYTIVVQDSDGNIIYTAGKCNKLYSNTYHKLKEQAHNYLVSNYPNWDDLTKYWD